MILTNNSVAFGFILLLIIKMAVFVTPYVLLTSSQISNIEVGVRRKISETYYTSMFVAFMITVNMITMYVTLSLLGEYVYCINYHKSFCGNYLLIELSKLNNVIDQK